MQVALKPTETEGELFRPSGGFIVSAHGTFTGDIFVYGVPSESFIAEADRVTSDWVKLHQTAITPTDPVASFDFGSGYICQVRAANAGARVVWSHNVIHSSKYQG